MDQPIMDQRTERQILTRYEREAVARFRAAYGLEDGDRWHDTVLEQALKDYGLPMLKALPTASEGPLDLTPVLAGALVESDQRRAWQRVHAMHLLAHAIINNGARCATCEDWGEPVRGVAAASATSP